MCESRSQKYCAKDGKWIGNIDPKAFTQKTSKFKDLEKVVKGELTLSGWVEQDYARIVDLQRVQLGLKLFKAIKARDNLQVCTDQIPNSWCIPMPITGDKRRHCGFGRQVQISVRQLGLSGYRTVFAARGITHLRASNPTSGRIPNSFCLTSIPEAKYSSQLSLTKCVMGHTFTPSKEGRVLFKNPSSLSLATETRRNSILTPGHSYRLDSMSFSLAKTISSREMTP